MNENMNIITEFMEKYFNPLTKKKEIFIIKSKLKEYKLTISYLVNDCIIFTCETNIEYYFASILKNDLYKFFLNNKININNPDDDFISLIKSNTLSVKEFLDIDIILICLTDKKTDDIILEFFMNKIKEKTMNFEVIKILFKIREKKQNNECDKIILNLNTHSLESFNVMYGLSLQGDEIIIDLTFDKKNSSKPYSKINSEGFSLFCQSNINTITKLILRNNDINDLNAFQSMNSKFIKHLDLAENNIINFSPLEKVHLERLEKLILSKNQIKDITCLKNINLPSLKQLDLSYNHIEDINCFENSSWSHLESFDLSHNKINSVEAFRSATFPVLKYLNLSTNSIINFHPLAKSFKKLCILILNQNKFNKLDFIGKCDFKYLKELYLFSCDITGIYDLTNGNFPNLQTLSLPENKLAMINPIELVKFPQLKKLSLYGNKIIEIAYLLKANFPELTELFLYKNKIEEIYCLKYFNFPKLKILSLMSNRISDISVFRDTPFNRSLEILALSKNNIKDISIFSSSSTTSFTCLKELWLDYNEIFDIDQLDKALMNNINKIKLGHNKIQNIYVIQSMTFKNLKEIDLNNNNISNINPLLSIGMKNLENINLTNNKFNVENNTNTLNILKNKGIKVILENNENNK